MKQENIELLVVKTVSFNGEVSLPGEKITLTKRHELDALAGPSPVHYALHIKTNGDGEIVQIGVSDGEGWHYRYEVTPGDESTKREKKEVEKIAAQARKDAAPKGIAAREAYDAAVRDADKAAERPADADLRVEEQQLAVTHAEERLDTKAAALDAKLAALDTKGAALDTATAALDAKLAALDTATAALDAKLAALNAATSNEPSSI